MELQRFWIKERAALGSAGRIYEVLDPRSQAQVGVVREKSQELPKTLTIFFSRRFLPTKLEARETEDESLVFTVRRGAGWRRRRLEVYDADERLMGYGFCGPGGICIWDASGLPFAQSNSGTGCFSAVDGRELAGLTAGDPYLVAMSDELAEQPLAKMLLLAAALLVIMYERQGK